MNQSDDGEEKDGERGVSMERLSITPPLFPCSQFTLLTEDTLCTFIAGGVGIYKASGGLWIADRCVCPLSMQTHSGGLS